MPEVKRLYEVNLPVRIMLKFTDRSSYVDVERIDGTFAHCKTEHGSFGDLYFGTKLVANPDGTWRIAESGQPDGGSHV